MLQPREPARQRMAVTPLRVGLAVLVIVVPKCVLGEAS